jgi:hypothetical protein
MPYTFKPTRGEKRPPAYYELRRPLRKLMKKIKKLKSRGNRPLQMDFEEMLDALIYFHLEEHESGRHLVQALEEDAFAREVIAPSGIKKSSFFEAINSRGLEQLLEVFEGLSKDAKKILPSAHGEFGDLVAIDGSLIDSVLSMEWADYRNGAKKAKAHIGFDINHGIPSKIFLTKGKGGERPFVSKILSPGQTGVMDRYYQRHKSFDEWQSEGKHFVCRIKENTTKTVIRENEMKPGSIVFYDCVVLLGTDGLTLTEKEVRVVGYRVEGKNYWVATDRKDLSGEDIAMIYKLRWNIESFFGWWKQHLKVYHLIARSPYGVMVQMLGGLITYLLLAIYCHEKHNEKVNIKRVRELRIQIRNESAAPHFMPPDPDDIDLSRSNQAYAST